MEQEILSLYYCGMNQHDIAEQIKIVYDVEIFLELVSNISEKISLYAMYIQNRPCFVFLILIIFLHFQALCSTQ